MFKACMNYEGLERTMIENVHFPQALDVAAVGVLSAAALQSSYGVHPSVHF